MHATPHTNLFGITTHYGTHPTPPKRRHPAWRVATHAATYALAAGITAVRLVRPRKAK